MALRRSHNQSHQKPQSDRMPLLGGGHHTSRDDAVHVVSLSYGQVPTGADTVHRAFVEDDIMVYYSSVDTAPFYNARWKFRHNTNFIDAVHQRRALTIDHGASVLEYGFPGNNKPSKGYSYILKLLEKFDTPELRKRKTEFRGMVKSLVQEAFGDAVEEMYDIQILATAPEAQGRGHASALVTAVTDMADAEGRDTWVITASSYTFYQKLGFVVVREGVLGGDNPSWKGKPVPVHVMRKRAGSPEGNSAAERSSV